MTQLRGDLQEIRYECGTARTRGSLMAEKAPQVPKEGEEISAWKERWAWGAESMASWSLPMGKHGRFQAKL